MTPATRAQAAAIDDAARALVAALDSAARDDIPRVSPTQMRVLSLLQDGPVNVNGLAETLGVGASSASRLCDRLEALGFVERASAARDRREVRLQLTVEARALLDKLAAQRRAAVAEILSRMPEPARAELVRSLAAFARAASDEAEAEARRSA